LALSTFLTKVWIAGVRLLDIPLMPFGVEHTPGLERAACWGFLDIPLMPFGVEHVRLGRITVLASSGHTFDAFWR